MSHRIKRPLRIRPGDKPAFLIPPSDPSATIVETKEEERLRFCAVITRHGVPLAAVVHIVFEEMAVQNAAVDDRYREFLVGEVIIATDEVPAMAGNVAVGAWHGRVPVFFSADVAVDAVSVLEPVDWAEEGTKTDEEVGSHG